MVHNTKNMEIKDVKYLALEGGGGKGVTYLGAVAALEALKVLPINLNENKLTFKKEENKLKQLRGSKIKGISGSSAGAITALCLAMGLKSDELAKILQTKEFFYGKERSVFDTFFDLHKFNDSDTPQSFYLRTIEDKFGESVPEFKTKQPEKAGIIINAAMEGFIFWLQGKFDLSEQPFHSLAGFHEKKNVNYAKFKKHIFHLINCGGLFSGFQPRYFLQNIISENLLKNDQVFENFKAYNEKFEDKIFHIDRKILASNNITFKQFYYLTGVDLIVTANNITNGIPLYFSNDRTPDFPVSEAVLMSMNLPLLYSPIHNDSNVFKNLGVLKTRFRKASIGIEVSDKDIDDEIKAYNDMYKGLFIDGGLLNNTPMHAFNSEDIPFDDHIDPRRKRKIKPLNPNVLSIRLTPYKQHKDGEVKEHDFSLENVFTKLVDTVLFYSETGQFRESSEYLQSIDLYTYDLTTANFAPDQSIRETPILSAFAGVAHYFSNIDKNPFPEYYEKKGVGYPLNWKDSFVKYIFKTKNMEKKYKNLLDILKNWED